MGIVNSSSMLMEPLIEKKQSFVQIKTKDKCSFRVCLCQEHIDIFFSILSKGLGVNLSKAHDFSHSSVLLNLMVNCLLSTSVGMCLPGRDATFIDFSSTFKGVLALNNIYVFEAEVGFKSSSTKMIVKRFTLTKGNNKAEKIVEGTIKVKADYKNIQMPGIEELRSNAMGMGLKNKVVLITGASRGIGEMAAKLFSLHQAKVAVNYYKGEEDADRIVAEILESGGEAFAVQCNVADRTQVHQMILEIEQQYGTIDILVNNAVRNANSADFMEQSWDEFQKDIDVIVKGAFNCCQEVIPFMKESGGGKIVNVSTVYTDDPIANQSKYIASKSALVGLSRSLAVELAHANIQVNMVVPSIVETDLSKGVSEMFLEGMANDTPMKRNAMPVDVVQAIIFLSSKMSSFTTGQKIMVTGGKGPFH